MDNQDHEALYKAFFEATLDGAAYCQMIFDEQKRPVDFIYIEVNKNFEKISGLKDVEGKKVTDLIPGVMASNPELFDIYGRVALTGNPEKFETYLQQLSRWFLISVYSSKKGFFMAAFTDITDQKKTEKHLEDAGIAARADRIRLEALAKDLEKFKLAVENASDQVVITDADGITLYINKATEKLTGYASEEIMGKKVGTLWGSLMPKKFYQDMWKTIKTDKKAFMGELQNRRKNGVLYDAELKISPVLDEKDNVIFFVGIERDISEEKKILKTKDEFMSLASHQLRTPPSIIGWYTETLKSGDLGPINEKQIAYLNEIYIANQRMVAIINSLLNISRIEMGTFAVMPQEVKIKDIIAETVKELVGRFNRKIDLTANYDPGLGLLRIDQNILQIIIDNLLSNAFKYSPPEDTKIELTVKMDDGALLLSVKDNGIGIPAKDQDRVFEKLFRADNAVSTNPDGTGLGLYMIKKIIVDGLNGKIWFDSKENEGTTFYVSLPSTGMKEKTGTTTLSRVQYYHDEN